MEEEREEKAREGKGREGKGRKEGKERERKKRREGTEKGGKEEKTTENQFLYQILKFGGSHPVPSQIGSNLAYKC